MRVCFRVLSKTQSVILPPVQPREYQSGKAAEQEEAARVFLSQVSGGPTTTTCEEEGREAEGQEEERTSVEKLGTFLRAQEEEEEEVYVHSMGVVVLVQVREKTLEISCPIVSGLFPRVLPGRQGRRVAAYVCICFFRFEKSVELWRPLFSFAVLL